METAVGTTNQGLEIDLTTRMVNPFTISPEDRRMYLGGKGLGLKLLFDRMCPGVDPLGEENILALMMGTLMGSGGPSSARFAAVSKSPLTGIMVSSSCGGPFGMACKTAGYECLLIRGRADAPLLLEIDANGVQFKDASDLWGSDTEQAQAACALDRQDGALVIGPAGENQVLYANIVSGHRYLGRGGLGAVMGSKNLKAVVARGGSVKILPADPKGFKKVCQQANRMINENPFTGEQYRGFGTNSNVRYCNEAGIIPVRNFRSGSDVRAELVSGQTFKERFDIKPDPCRPCTIACGHRGYYSDGVHHIPEYETVGLFGPNLEIFDPEKITEWNDLCGRMGMDTISCASTLAYVMEAGERGLMQTGLKFGSPEGVSEAIIDTALRRGAGDEIANGSRWLSKKYGGMDFAMQVKGMELAAYDPRGAWGQGLAFAVANRGGCHLSATIFPLEAFFKFLKPTSIRGKPEFTWFFESLYAAVNSIDTCLFTTFAYVLQAPIVRLTPKPLLSLIMQYFPNLAIFLMDYSVFSKLVETSIGMKLNQRQLLRIGERVHVLERYMNTREGISRLDDTLPERLLAEGRTDDPQQQTVPLEQMLEKYYRIRGYDENGIPTPQALKRLGILHSETADENEFALAHVRPRRKRFKQLINQVVMFVLGRALQTASRYDSGLQLEAASWPEGFVFMFKVLPHGGTMAVGRGENGRLVYRGAHFNERKASVIINFKNVDAAFLTFTAQLGTDRAYAQHRMSAKGDLTYTMSVIRCLDIVETYLFPRLISKRILKRVPKIPGIKRHLIRLRIYFIGIPFGI